MTELMEFVGHIRNHEALCAELGLAAGLSREGKTDTAERLRTVGKIPAGASLRYVCLLYQRWGKALLCS